MPDQDIQNAMDFIGGGTYQPQQIEPQWSQEQLAPMLNALQATQGGQSAPQGGQGSPSYPQTEQQQAQGMPSVPQIGGGVLPQGGLQNDPYLKQLLTILQPTQAQLDFQKVAQKGPQQIAQGMYDQMFGLQRDPQTNKVTGRNWLKFITQAASEIGRSVAEKDKYVPPMERLIPLANQQYQSQVAPFARELEYTSLNQRAALGDIQRYLGNLYTNQVRQESADTNRIRAQIYAVNSTYGNTLKTQEASGYLAKNDLYGAQAALDRAKGDMTREQLKVYQQHEQEQGLPQDARVAIRLGDLASSSDPEDQKDYKALTTYYPWLKNLGVSYSTVTQGNDTYRVPNKGPQVRVPLGSTPGTQTPPAPPPPNPNNTGGATQQDIDRAQAAFSQVPAPGQPGSGFGPNGAPNKPQRANGLVVPPNITWAQPAQRYGTGWRTNTEPITQQWDDLKPGETSDNSALLRSPIVPKFNEQQENQMRAARDVLGKGREFNTLLNSLPENVFSSFKGNFLGFLLGKVNFDDLQKMGINVDSDTQAKLARLRTLATTTAYSHIGAQGRVSTPLVEEIQRDIMKYGTSKNVIANTVDQYVQQGRDTLRNIPGSQKIAATDPYMNRTEFQHIYDPEAYRQDKMQAAREILAERQKAKNKSTK